MRRTDDRIAQEYPERFTIGMMSMQGVIMEQGDDDTILFRQMGRLMRETFAFAATPPATWDDWITWFAKDAGLFSRPVIRDGSFHGRNWLTLFWGWFTVNRHITGGNAHAVASTDLRQAVGAKNLSP